MFYENINHILHRGRTTVTSVTKHFSPVAVTETPHMTHAETKAFEALLSEANTYVEYGTGGSTRLAAKHVDTIISVENDRRFANAVRRSFEGDSSPVNTVTIDHASLGPSGNWGYPVFTWETDRFAEQQEKYVESPWERLYQQEKRPDLILIDGRFRVASTLYSLNQLSPLSDTRFFFHDFRKREETYSAIEPFIDVHQEVDSAIIFKKKDGAQHEEISRAYEQNRFQWR